MSEIVISRILDIVILLMFIFSFADMQPNSSLKER